MARALEKLSDLKVRKAKTPGYLGDGGGLYLQISASLSKSWVFRYQINGRAREMGLGAFHSFGLSDARKRAMKCRQMVTDGIDPIDDRKSAQQQKRLTEARTVAFGRCAGLYIEAHRSGWKNAKHAAQWESTLATYCKPIWDVPVDRVDTELVMLCLNPIWTTKTETASRLRGRIESVLAWATVRKLRTGDNPAAWRNHLDVEFHPKLSHFAG
ncbi:tyrosine-type recombinase/integrase [Rhodanobacter umsongensis]